MGHTTQGCLWGSNTYIHHILVSVRVPQRENSGALTKGVKAKRPLLVKESLPELSPRKAGCFEQCDLTFHSVPSRKSTLTEEAQCVCPWSILPLGIKMHGGKNDFDKLSRNRALENG